jgi:copper chaperone
MRTMTLTISGMSCGHCLNAVNQALSSLPGVQVLGVRMGRAEVAYDPARIESARVIASVEAAGYEVAGSSETGAEV